MWNDTLPCSEGTKSNYSAFSPRTQSITSLSIAIYLPAVYTGPLRRDHDVHTDYLFHISCMGSCGIGNRDRYCRKCTLALACCRPGTFSLQDPKTAVVLNESRNITGRDTWWRPSDTRTWTWSGPGSEDSAESLNPWLSDLTQQCCSGNYIIMKYSLFFFIIFLFVFEDVLKTGLQNIDLVAV